jgi:hypothetical protein
VELADAMVYPSKQVADRFKAQEVRLKDGELLAGFITEQTDDTSHWRHAIRCIAFREVESNPSRRKRHRSCRRVVERPH